MNTHLLNVLGSAVLTILLGILLVYWGSVPEFAWRNVLIATYILGYAHFIIGYIYQMRSVFRADRPVRLRYAFFIVTLLAALFAMVLLHLGQIRLLGLLVIPYFMIHVLLNEYTLSKQETGRAFHWLLLTSIGGWFTALLLLGVRHNSFFYHADLTYLHAPAGFFLPLLQETAPLWLFTTVPYALLIVSIPTLCYEIAKLRMLRVSIPLLFTVFAGTAIALYFDPITYVYVFGFVLSYHFILWMFHFAIRFYATAQRELQIYIFLHVLIFLPLICAALFTGPLSKWIYITFLNSEMFVIITYVHITLAFLNETWVKKVLYIT